jgi:hypothetical protein
VQAAYAAASSLHSNVTGLSGELKVMLADVCLLKPLGALVMSVSGGSVAMVQLCDRTGPMLPARSTPRTSNV